MDKKFAFTLAELLIAVMIIGIVAVLTIPTFIANSSGKQHRVSYLKGVSTLARAATANYGLSGYDFSGTNGYYGTQDIPNATYSTPGGAVDAPYIGFDTLSIAGQDLYSDLHKDTTSLFHIWQDNLKLKSSKEFTNYAVAPADITLNCASRANVEEVELRLPGGSQTTKAVIKPDFKSREYWTDSIIQGSGNIASLCDGRTLEQGGLNQGRMFMMDDGMVFTYDPAQAYCLETNPCYGYLDVNGPDGPNRVISCSEGEDSYITTYGKNALPGMLLGDCTVKTSDITDIYPVLFYNNVVKPASWAAKSVFNQTISNQIAPEEIANAGKKD